MKKITCPEELIASAGRQGVKAGSLEAEIVLGYMESHGYELLMNEEYALTLHDTTEGDDHELDTSYTIRDAVELCVEMNKELLVDACGKQAESGGGADELTDLRKDQYILEDLLSRTAAAVPPTLTRFNVVVIEHWKKVVPTMAASWAEAVLKVQQAWKDGEITLTPADLADMTVTLG